MDSLEYLQIRLDQLSENKIFIGLIMIIVNIGARFIIEELSDEHRSIVKSRIFRKLIIFCSVFMATRDIIVAIIVTTIFTVLMEEILKSDEKVMPTNQNNQGISVKQELDKKIDELKIIKDSL